MARRGLRRFSYSASLASSASLPNSASLASFASLTDSQLWRTRGLSSLASLVREVAKLTKHAVWGRSKRLLFFRPKMIRK